MYEATTAPGDVKDRGPVAMTLSRLAGRWVVSVSADKRWLSAKGRKWPVVVDPSLFTSSAQVSSATDCYIVSGASANNSACAASSDKVGFDGTNATRTLLNFNLQGQLPADAQVEEADLTLAVTGGTTNTSTTVGAYALTRGFSSGATWNTYDGSHAWTSAGGDFNAQLLSTVSIPTPQQQPSGFTNLYWPMTGLAQGWVDGSTPNLGVLLKEPSETTNNVLSFGSSTATCAGPCGPSLDIFYVPRTGAGRGMHIQSQQLSDRMSLGINVANGNMVLQNTDLNIHGTGVDELLARTYNNSDSEYSPSLPGSGWKLGLLDTKLDLGHVYAPNAPDVTYIDPTGAHYVYDGNGTGGFVTPPGVDAPLTKNADGTFVLAFRDGSKENFDSYGNLTSTADKNGNRIAINYNGGTNLPATSVTDSQGRVTNLTYSSSILSSVTDSSGRTVTYGSDVSGNLTSATDAAGKTTTYAYDSNGNLNQITDPAGHVTNIAYEPLLRGRVTSVTRVTNNSTGAGDTTTYAYNAPSTTIPNTSGGCPASNTGAAAYGQTVVTDALGHATTYCYDTHDRVFAAYDATGHQRQSSFTTDDNVTRFTTPSGAYTTVGYDTQDRPNGAKLPASASGQTQAAYSASYDQQAGHPYLPDTTTDPQGNKLTYGYDSAQNVTSITNGLTSQNTLKFTYNSNGTVATSIDGNGNQTIYSYTNGNLTSIVAPTATGGLGVTTLGYDSLSRVTSIKDGKGQTETISYDAMDRPTKETFGDGKTITYTYDADGNLTQQVDSASGTSTYTYDAKNRITQESLPGAHTNSYTYDNADNLTSVTDPNGKATYSYDTLNRLTSLLQPGQSTAVTFSYNQDDHRTAINYPNKVAIAMSYDPAGHMLSTAAAGPSGTIASLNYSYTQGTTDRDIIQSRTDNKTGNVTAYSYDALERLTEAKATNAGTQVDDRRYTFDGAGNILTRTINGTASSYGYNANNELTTGPAGTYSYDANGNQLGNSAGLKLAYNAKNQTTSITPAGQSATSLTYLGAGQASLTGIGSATQVNDLLGVGYRTDSTGTTYYTHDNNSNLLSERNPAGGYYYYVPDAQGSILALTDSAGNTANTYSYDPYGQTTSSSGTTPNVWGYQQGEQGPAGTYHFGQRYYDPATGRWTQQDPLNQISDPQQADRYAYVSGNPVNGIDPSGLFSIDFSLKIGLGVHIGLTIAGGQVHTYFGVGVGAVAGLSYTSQNIPRHGVAVNGSVCAFRCKNYSSSSPHYYQSYGAAIGGGVDLGYGN